MGKAAGKALNRPGGRSAGKAARTTFLPEGVGDFLRRRAIEAGGLLLIGMALALFLALVSFDPGDPSLNTAADGQPSNLLGHVGAVVSDVVLQTLGLAGALPVPILAGWGWRLVVERRLKAPWLRTALLPVALLLAAMALATLPVPVSWPLEAGLGGFAGALLLIRLLGVVGGLTGLAGAYSGALLVGFVLALPATALVVYVLGFSWQEWRGGGRRLADGARAVQDGAKRLAAKFRRSDDAPPEEKAARPRRVARDRVEPVLASPKPIKPDLVAPKPDATKPGKRAAAARQRSLDLPRTEGTYELPPLDLLDEPPESQRQVKAVNEEALQQNARLLEGVLDDFGVRGEIVKVRPGPVVTLYELEPAPGTKTSRVIGLSDDIARSMSAVSVRIAVIPGRNVIGIELPNATREMVYLRELLAAQAYEKANGRLPLVLGKDIGGAPIITDLARMPHLLIAGTTGSGKSVGLNAMILSLLYRLTPEACKLILIDPKMLELAVYDDIPHLIAPVVTEPKKAVVALKWTVREMEQRYRGMSKLGVRNIEGYNRRVAEARAKGEVLMRRVQTGYDAETGKPIMEEQPLDLSPLPFIVVIVDEMADLMLVAGKDIEAAIQRLAQMARAAGIHLIMATQRPSVDVVTGTIKANFPTRISFQVTSRIDSRTILGEQGAEQLLGQGDMLHMAGGGRITRVHGPFVSDEEVESVVAFLKNQGEPTYIEAVTEDDDSPFDTEAAGVEGGSGDELFDRAVRLVCQERKASTSFIQRHLQIGYNRAARIIEQMEKEGIVSPADHVGRREVLGSGAGELAD